MKNSHISRNRQLNIPITVKNEVGMINTVADRVAADEAHATAHDRKLNREVSRQKAETEDAEWKRISKIPESSSDLIVITKVKKLGAYVIAATEKSPAKYRGVFVNRMQNYCLDALQDMLNANFIRPADAENRRLRAQYQTDALIKLKMLAYVAMVAQNAGCILLRQYKQISLQIGETVNLLSAWKKATKKNGNEHKRCKERFDNTTEFAVSAANKGKLIKEL